MKPIYNAAAPRTSIPLTINSDLLIKSRALNINLSAALEKALIQQLAEHARGQWIELNRNAIRSYNEFVEKNVCFGDEYRDF
ncbi:MAG: type II toxin-antitoxin system CcdA family antitoxin [Halioglobus sp.]|nr:type II toxin-antitoxin system CcdA family antitoxin [Halioglobus sp.]